MTDGGPYVGVLSNNDSHRSPIQTNKYSESPLRNSVGEVPFSPCLLSPAAVVPAAGNDPNIPLGAISPNIFSPGSKLLKKRFSQGYNGGTVGDMSSPDRLLLPGFQQSVLFEGRQPARSRKSGLDQGVTSTYQSKSLWGNEITPQESSSNNNVLDLLGDERRDVDNRGCGSGERSSSSLPSTRTGVTYRSMVTGSGSRSKKYDSNYSSKLDPDICVVSTRQGPEISPGEQSPCGVLDMGDSPVRLLRCNCKKSRCLKLYCECFANLRYCSDCNCMDCHNMKEHDHIRREAIKNIKERNSTAFTNKVASGKAHATGCHCKNSLCLKKYCECFQASAYCGANCKCLSCQNFEGSVALSNAKFSARGTDRKRKGSPAAPTVSCVSESNTPDNQDQGSLKAAKVDSSSSRVVHEASDAANTPPSAKPSRRSRRSGAHRNKTLEDEQYEQSQKQAAAQRAQRSSRRVSHSQINERVTRTRSMATAPGSTSAPLVYPFFGSTLPSCSKFVALNCLDYLSNGDIYSMSLVSTYWARASMDDALWTTEDG